MTPMTRFSAVVLVDPEGRILLQERDEHAVIDPERWGFVGGHVEDDEGHEAAAYRELAEETGIELAPGDLLFWHELPVEHPSYGAGVMHVYVAPTTLTDDDIVCGEGRRIVFVDPATARTLELTGAAAEGVPAFLDSDLYSTMAP